MPNNIAPQTTTFRSLDGYCKTVHDTFFPMEFRLKTGGAPGFFCRFQTSRFGPLDMTEAYVMARSNGHRGRDLVDPKEPDEFVLNIVRSGLVRQTQFGRKAEMPSGFMTLASSRSPLDTEQLGATSALYIKIPGAPLRAAIATPEDLCGVPIDVRSGLGAVFFNLLRSTWRERERLAERERDTLSMDIIELFASVCGKQLERSPCPARTTSALILEKAARYIESHLGNPQLSPDRIAKALNVSCSHLHAVARGKGPTIGRTILLKRIERCRQLLSDPRLAHRQISEIAFDCGFNDAAHFSRAFKSRVGVSARIFRKQQLAATAQQPAR